MILNKPTLAAIVGSGSFAEVAYSGLATDLTFPPEASAPFILYSTIKWLLPSIDAMQADRETTDPTAVSYIKNKPQFSFDSENNMLFLGQINYANNVTAAAFYGSGAGLTNLPIISQWTTAGSSVYIGGGSNVGIGKSTPTCALDVSGGVAVSGSVAVSGTTTQTGHVGIGKGPHATYSLDVSGSVNATSLITSGTVNANALATGGYSTARQFDCGSFTTTGLSTALYFHFTFTNIPYVVATIATNIGAYIVSPIASGVSQTGFWITVYIFNGSVSQSSGHVINWIAIG